MSVHGEISIKDRRRMIDSADGLWAEHREWDRGVQGYSMTCGWERDEESIVAAGISRLMVVVFLVTGENIKSLA